MKNFFNYIVAPTLVAAVALTITVQTQAQPDPNYKIHDFSRPQPMAINPGYPGDQDRTGKAPSDAIVLFDGTNLDNWSAMDGSPTKWVIKDGVMECVPGSGYIRTLQCFGDCQLHIEWSAPTKVQGEGQGRGNSGLFFGNARYEIQVLDSYDNITYPDGHAGSIYAQYPPEVMPIRKPGEWNTYDVVYTAPRFETDGSVKSPAYITLFFNGILVQWQRELTGPTGWLSRSPYTAHDIKQPIAFQDHGNPVKFRNVWVRELGCKVPEFKYSNEYIDKLSGKFNGAWGFERQGDKFFAVKPGFPAWQMRAINKTTFKTDRTDFTFEFADFNNEGIPQTVYWTLEGHKSKLTRAQDKK